MAVSDILLMSDNDVAHTIGIGMVVVPLNPYLEIPLLSRNEIYSSHVRRSYGHAVVVSLNPFILVSEDAGMRWETTIAIADVIAIGKVRPEVMDRVLTRLSG